MNSFSMITGLSFALLLSPSVDADESEGPTEVTTIPLNTIWGYNLPGTRDISGIPFPEKPEGIGQTLAFLGRERDYNIEQIRRALMLKSPTDKASPGFVIPSTCNSRTLLAVHPMLRGKPNPLKRNLPEGEFTLIFFSHPLSYYARLRAVERDDDRIIVRYQFEPHTTPESTVHLALIPLGTLAAGEYKVDYEQIPLDQKYRDKGFEPVHPQADDIVCRNFSFTVSGPPNNEPLNEGATFIPLNEIWAYEMPGTRDVIQLDTENADGTSHPLIDSLHRNIAKRFKTKAGSAFVVEGNNRAALENMLRGFINSPSQQVPAKTDLSLIFYTRFSGHYVHLETVERITNRFMLTYRIVTHATFNMSFHFALIPLGKLPAGTYEVEIKQSPSIDSTGRPVTLDRDFTSIVCQETTFYVKEKEP
jgi:hypothetical protein